MAIYDLMLKNRCIGYLEIIGDSVTKIKLSNWFSKVYHSPEDFILNRIDIVHRNNILDMCKIVGINNLEDYANITKCISTNDAFWLNNKSKPTEWDKISPYTNSISTALAEYALNGRGLLNGQHIKLPSPQYRIAGSADKCVKRIPGKRGIYLYKSMGTIEVETVSVRPYSEYFAYQVAKQLGINNSIEYTLHEHIANNGHIKLYCVCKLFTDENNSLIDYEDSIYRDKSLLDIINILLKNNNKQEARNIANMIILDSIILNCDRHSNNYGFILNNSTGNIVGFAPIYDNDCSLGSLNAVRGYSFEDAFDSVIARQPKTGLGNYNEQALACMYKDMYIRLKTIGKIHLHRGNAKSISTERLDFMEYLVNRRIKEIIALVEEHYDIQN